MGAAALAIGAHAWKDIKESEPVPTLERYDENGNFQGKSYSMDRGGYREIEHCDKHGNKVGTSVDYGTRVEHFDKNGKKTGTSWK